MPFSQVLNASMLFVISVLAVCADDQLIVVAKRVDDKILGLPPAVVQGKSRGGKTDVIVLHTLEKNERAELVRSSRPILCASLNSKGRLVYILSGKDTWEIVARKQSGEILGRIKGDNFGEMVKGSAAGAADLSPDDKVLLCASWVIPAPRSEPRPRIITYDIASGKFGDRGLGLHPSFHPDGKSILFTDVVTKEGKVTETRLSVMNIDGSNRRPIAEAGTLSGAYSSDGKHLAFLKIGQFETEVWIADSDGKNLKRAITPRGVYGSPRPLLDGKRVAVIGKYSDVRPALLATADRKKKVESKSKDAKGTKGNRTPSQEEEYDIRNSDSYLDLFLFSTETPNVRRLTALRPVSEEAETVDFNLDSTSRNLAGMLSVKLGNALTPIYQPPAGQIITYAGTKVFLQDAKGNRVPMPDGVYKISDGYFMDVRGGQKWISSYDPGELEFPP